MSRYFASIARIHYTIIREYTHLNFEKVRHDTDVRLEVVGGGRLAAGAGRGRWQLHSAKRRLADSPVT